MYNLRSNLWRLFTNVYPKYLRFVKHMDIGDNVRIAPQAHIDKTYPQGIHIGNETIILKGSFVLSHDSCRSLHVDTYIGDHCVIGINCIILPGVHIGSHVVIGAGSIVSKDIPSHSVAVGNPAKVIKEGIKVVNGKIQNM